MKKLVIIESPNKSKTIKQYLGADYEVLSSKGHIRDLSISNVGGLGLDIENNFAPKYDIIKNKETIVKTLKKAANQADEIYLATDPDREGEAISWHLQQVLDLKDKPTHRVIFNEVTKDAVQTAFKNPRHINLSLVSSQETRRILDRIIGFKLSKLLQNKIKSKSAGRVQSAALKILVDREKEINVFIKEEYWKVKAIFKDFDAELSSVNNKKPKLHNQEEANQLVLSLNQEFIVKKITQTPKKRQPKPPFITSSLQQEASTKLNMNGQRTMMVAQKLYEGIDLKNEAVGLITYMRTDSTRLSDSFIGPLKTHIKNQYGEAYVGSKPATQKNKKGQDAHEAIRPTDLKYTPDSVKTFLNKDEYRLYKMIYYRTVASLMKSLKYTSTIIELSNGNTIFKANAQKLDFDGYLIAYSEYENFDIKSLPKIEENTTLNHQKLETTQHFTSPPERYTEARLIKEMDDLGIGRPSTYAQTVSTLKNRQYISLEEKKFVPTEQGMLTIEKLDQYFSRIINVDYTAKMEKILDDIASNGTQQNNTVKDFYNTFIPLVEKANQEMTKEAPKTTGEVCTQCGRPMVFRESRYGAFEACSGYPECKYIKSVPVKKKEVVSTGVTCPKCHIGIIVERVATKGKNRGNTFYACNNFPKCKHILTGKPTQNKCPKCQNILVEGLHGTIQCDDIKECSYKIEQ